MKPDDFLDYAGDEECVVYSIISEEGDDSLAKVLFKGPAQDALAFMRKRHETEAAEKELFLATTQNFADHVSHLH